jgi:hypothetical protein
MPSYFRQVPDFDYVSRDPNQRQISEYAPVKNLFRRGKLREDIFGNLSYFTKYKIIGDERPDNVAYKIYNDETLDWIVLLSNNILNIQTEWPLPQVIFDKVMLEKYGSYDELYNGIHHYETNEIRDSSGNIILPSGIQMPSQWKSGNGFVQGYKINQIVQIFYEVIDNFYVVIPLSPIPLSVGIKQGNKIIIKNSSIESLNSSFVIDQIFLDNSRDNIEEFSFLAPNVSVSDAIIPMNGNETIEFISYTPLAESDTYYYNYYDNNLQLNVQIPSNDIIKPITNYEYENKLEEDKRNIFVLKPQYLNIVFNDMEEIMKYKKGSTQYVSRTLKKGDNIRLYS